MVRAKSCSSVSATSKRYALIGPSDASAQKSSTTTPTTVNTMPIGWLPGVSPMARPGNAVKQLNTHSCAERTCPGARRQQCHQTTWSSPIKEPFKNMATPSRVPTQRARTKGLLRPHRRVQRSLAEPITGVKSRPRTGLRNQVRL